MKAKRAATRMMKIIVQRVFLALSLIVSCTTVSNTDIRTWPRLCTWASECSDGYSTKAKKENEVPVVMDYTKEARRYQQEVSSYLDKVRRGRRVATANPADPKFSEEAERARQLKSLGLTPQKKTSMIDPVETLRTGLQALERGQENFDVNAHHERMLNSGPFADASKRHSLWAKPSAHVDAEGNDLGEDAGPILTAQLLMGGGKSNTETMKQLKAIEEEDAAMGIRKETSKAPDPLAPYTLKPAVDSSARFKEMEAQDKARAEAERQAQKKKNRQLLGLE